MRDNNNQRTAGGGRAKTATGTFRLGSAIVHGLIVREDPVKRYSQRGTPWTEATLLIDLYDSRKRAERERPAFIRVKAFNELADELHNLRKKERLHVAGLLLLDVWEGRDGNVRESYELHADAISRQPFPKLGEMIANHGSEAAGDPHGGTRYEDEPGWRGDSPGNEAGGAPEAGDPPPPDDLGEPWGADGGQTPSADDIPF